MLQNIHLMQAWLKDLERALEVIEEFVHDETWRFDPMATDRWLTKMVEMGHFVTCGIYIYKRWDKR
jgi:hypothetical protein